MKKRLLITSIVMMLVVAVALGTSTYAWFTSNGTVTASSVTLTAALNNADALGIGWTGGEASSSISNEVSGTLNPMAPDTLTVGTTTSETIKFRTGTTKQANSVIVFNTDVAETDLYKKFASAGNVSSFYVKNLSTANTVPVITVSGNYTSVTDNGQDMIRVAIFTQEYVPASGKYASGTTYYTYSTADHTFSLLDTSSGFTDGVTDMNPELHYVKSANHTLLGVLGESNTTFAKATTFDKNAVYFKLKFATASITSENFVADGTLYTANAGVYTAVTSGTFDGSATYYTISEKEQVSVADATAFATEVTGYETYYTAANTAVYGDGNKIKAGEAVKDLNYYTDVKTSLTLTTNLLPLEEVEIVAIVWLDGTELNDDRQGDAGTVSLEFTASKS